MNICKCLCFFCRAKCNFAIIACTMRASLALIFPAMPVIHRQFFRMLSGHKCFFLKPSILQFGHKITKHLHICKICCNFAPIFGRIPTVDRRSTDSQPTVVSVPVVISINLKLPAESSIANAMKTTSRINLSARNGTQLPSSMHISNSVPSLPRPNPKPNWNLSTNHPSTLPPTANLIPLSAPGNSTPFSTTGNKNIRSNKVLSASSVYRSIVYRISVYRYFVFCPAYYAVFFFVLQANVIRRSI